MKINTHLCLVSSQATPNLIPIIGEETRPIRVVLAVSKNMGQQADWLEKVMQIKGVKIERLEIPDPYDFDRCWDIISDWLVNQKVNVALNVTGGTKIMAIAAQDVFRTEKKIIFYVNIQDDSILRLDRNEKPIFLPAKIGLKEYLESHGFTLKDKVKPPITIKQRNFFKDFIKEAKRLKSVMGSLNYLSMQAKETLSCSLEDKIDSNEKLQELIKIFATGGYLSLEKSKLVFPDEESRKFVNGGWLEFLVFQTLADLKPKLQLSDYAMGLQITGANHETSNELDGAFLHGNTLHIIECKTANLMKETLDNMQTKGTDTLYKLNSLRELGGIRTKVLLVDYQGLNLADKERANQMKIKVISVDKLLNLENELMSWCKSG